MQTGDVQLVILASPKDNLCLGYAGCIGAANWSKEMDPLALKAGQK